MLRTGIDLSLPDHVSHQITSVLRLKAGDEVQLFNGDGSEYTAEIINVRRGAVDATVTRCEPGLALPTPPLTIALALIKHDRFEWALQKLTELGVDRVIPLATERTVLSFRVDRAAQRYARWQRIVVEAAEQSGRATPPEIEAVADFSDVFRDHPDAHVIVLWEDEQAVDLPQLFDSRPTILLIGPEGGFSATEIDRARELGAVTASLGPLTLRSETAAVAAAAMMLAHRMNQKTV